MLSLLVTSRRSQCISHVVLFLVTHIEPPSSAVGNRMSGWTELVGDWTYLLKAEMRPTLILVETILGSSMLSASRPRSHSCWFWKMCAWIDSFEIWSWFQIYHFSGKLPLFKINEEFSFYRDTLPKWPLPSNSETFPIFSLITTHNMRQEFLNFQFLWL